MEQMKCWCLLQAGRMQEARINAHRLTLCAKDSIEACMRMLTIFATDQQIRTFYLQSRQLATAAELDAHELGEDAPFWVSMTAKFNDSTNVFPTFPHDHKPTNFTVLTDGQVTFVFEPPPCVAQGFLAGMNLLKPQKPPHYAETFFSKTKLRAMWKDSLKLYRSAMTNWQKSGEHNSQPFYHYVFP